VFLNAEMDFTRIMERIRLVKHVLVELDALHAMSMLVLV